MKRDLDQLSGRTFDILVVGGGIYGLTIAYDAAQRGLSVALIEREDFGSGTSFNHLRTIHGGLRYLQTLDLARARESVRERRTLAIIAPDFVRPQRFVLPLGSSLMRGPLAMRAGFALDALVASDRNAGVPNTHRLPAGRVVGGAAVWYDYVTTEADRLTFSFGLAAAGHGAVLANYVEATAPVVESGRVTGVHAVDRQTGRELDVAARITVNATGANVNRLIGLVAPASRPIPMLQAMNLITHRQAADEARGGQSAAGRTLFLVPWRERALFGTWEADRICDPADPGATTIAEADIAAFVGQVNEAFPAMQLQLTDIALVQRGVVPAAVNNGSVALEGHERVIDHGAQGIEGLLSVSGTKYTTARGVAERVTDRLLGKLKRPRVPCRTHTTPLPKEGIRRPGPVADDEFVRAVRTEMAMTLSDVVIRRTPFGVLGHPGDAALEHAAAVVAAAAGWSDDRRRSEVEATKRFYGTLNALKT